MIKKIKILVALLLIIFQYQLKAQSTIQSNAYFEILGPGGIYSANYEARFGEQPNNLGIRLGLSYSQASSASLVTFPVGLNYLLGKDEKYFEIGANATYAHGTINDIYSDGSSSASGSTVFGTLIFGYRKQPTDGGFLFRAGVSPVFGKGFFYAYWPYLSLGYSFK